MSTQNSGKNSGLRPWKRGQSGNPGGRPKANIALRTKCRELDDEMLERLKVIAHVADTDAASRHPRRPDGAGGEGHAGDD